MLIYRNNGKLHLTVGNTACCQKRHPQGWKGNAFLRPLWDDGGSFPGAVCGQVHVKAGADGASGPLAGVAFPLSSLQLSRKALFLQGMVIVARSIINIHRGALLITFLINSMQGALGVDEGCGRAVVPWSGRPPLAKFVLPCRIHPWARSSSSQPNRSPQGSSLLGWGGPVP